jgi:hypothetical protein
MVDVLLTTSDISVLGGPETVNVEVDFGSTGDRGSQIYAVSGQPNKSSTYIPEIPNVYDLAINISPSDEEYQFIYQYVNGSWTPLFKLISNFYNKNYTDASFSNGEWSILIPVISITSQDVTSENFNIQYTINGQNPIASSITIGEIDSGSGEQALPITIYASELINSEWNPLSGTKVIQIFISVV